METVQFKDVERAKRAVSMAKINHIRILIGLAIALIATGITVYQFFVVKSREMEYYLVPAVVGVFSYLVGGGIFDVLRTVGAITRTAWWLIPIFPFNLIIAILGFFLGIFCLCLVPVIFVGLNYKRQKQTLDAARSYLAMCGYVMEAEKTETAESTEK